ncbi:MAG: SUMF1/EgtB/PvdO family nonheme iron enzyme [bacterium]
MRKIICVAALASLFFVLLLSGCAKSTPTASAPEPVDYAALVSVPGGTFLQSDGTNSFTHIISAFKMGKYQVTYDLWFTVYHWAITHGYNFQNAGTEGNDGIVGADTTVEKYEPVTIINWRDAIVWCNAFSEKSSLAPCYYYASAVIRDSRSSNSTACDGVICVWENNGYRLPSEGEWQYAASYIGGLTWTPYNYASGAIADTTDNTETGRVAWYIINSGGHTNNVGSKDANALGIYDMSGNVWEFCWDWYGTYPTGTITNYRGLVSGTLRTLRGGDFMNTISYLQLGHRAFPGPSLALAYYGFRFARTY